MGGAEEPEGRPTERESGCRAAGRGSADQARPHEHAVARKRSAKAVATGVSSAAGTVRAKGTRATVWTPPSRNATTADATVKAASAVQAAPNASCARSRPGLCAVAENARPDAASRLGSQGGTAG